MTVIDDGKGYNVVWNVMLASIQSSTNISVSTTDGGEGKVTTEALKNNDKAGVPVTVDIEPGALNEDATIWVRPVYTDKSGGSRATENRLLVGAEVGCSDALWRFSFPLPPRSCSRTARRPCTTASMP